MNESGNFINNFLVHMDGKVNDKELKIIQSELINTLTNYEVSKKETSLVVMENYLPQCYQIFMVAKKIEGRTEATLQQYKYQLEKFFYYIQKPINEISKEDVIVYLYAMGQKGNSGKSLSATSIDNIRLCLNSFFNWANQNGYIDKNPVATIGRIKGEVKAREPLKELEVEALRDAIIHYNINKNTPSYNLIRARDLALFEVLYSTGCRVSEIVNLNKEDIDYTSSPPVVKVFGKGQKYRNSYLNAKAIYYLSQYLKLRTDDNNALFCGSREPFKRLTKSGIEAALKKYEKLTAIKLYPHKIRHTTATQGLKHGMPIEDLQAMLGHIKPETTMIYAHLSDSEVKYAHNKYIN